MEELLYEMQKYADANKVPIIKKEAAEILCHIAAEAKPQRILEIGTAIGYSALLLADSSKSAAIVTLEIDDDRIKTAEQFINKSPYKNSITIIKGDAGETLKKLHGEFDFVFIDAAKGHYVKYLKAVLPMLAAGGIIAADNVLFRGYVEGKLETPRRYKTIVKRLREYIREVNNNMQFSTKIYYEGDGLAVSKKQI